MFDALSHTSWRWALVCLLIVASGCGEDEHTDPADEPDEIERVVESDFGNYFVEIEPAEEPVPFNAYTDLTVRVFSDAELTHPVGEAELEFDARVEEVDGRLATVPSVEQTGPGVFEVRGVLFHVPRRWELRLDIQEDGFSERAVALVDPRRGFESGTDPSGFFSDEEVSRILSLSPEGGAELPEVPSNAHADDEAAATLGQFLFFDTRLSADGSVACASCHVPDQGFGDAQQLAVGIGQVGRHAPTVINAAYSRWQFWDGRVDTLWSQALQPFEADLEHGTNRMRIVRLLTEDDDYSSAYEEVFGPLPDVSDTDRFPADARPIADGDGHPEHDAWMDMAADDRLAVNEVYANIGKAIEAYERRVVSLNSPFDRFVEGLREQDESKLDAIDETAKRGLKLFLGEAQCDLCHAGPMLSNFEFHNLGLDPRDWMPEGDLGRFDGAERYPSDPFNAVGPFSDAPDQDHPQLEFLRSGEFRQEGAFKTPTLRNVAQTAPYMHGGHFETLEEVINFYADLQEDAEVGRRDALVQPFKVSSEQTDDLVAFMEALTGEDIPAELTSPPDSPVHQP